MLSFKRTKEGRMKRSAQFVSYRCKLLEMPRKTSFDKYLNKTLSFPSEAGKCFTLDISDYDAKPENSCDESWRSLGPWEKLGPQNNTADGDAKRNRKIIMVPVAREIEAVCPNSDGSLICPPLICPRLGGGALGYRVEGRAVKPYVVGGNAVKLIDRSEVFQFETEAESA